MPLSTHAGDLFVNGSLIANSITLPANAVNDNAVAAAANLAASKLEHQYEPCYSQLATADAATDRRVIHIVYGATGSIVDFRVGAITAAGAASSATIDLKKNGSTVLSGTITLDNGTASLALEQPAGYTSTSLVTGDVLEVHITAVAGANLAKGLFAQLVVREKAQ